ncbi:MAG: pyrroline-5-carboxylate reductase [Methylobacterium sp.]|nr:pyrroline-5-carboxylate reductase [Methylobacterium sp.]MCA3602043.1 pyrroline-5-carboxylate reductase [Methylobacterium sp.]MCA3614820.1 pyrroline-5-carboxylate reductase [Methylobacterium sp.]MCA4910402.1 pyrroline-5-carboxylate reductase [Methylobacterium sp.]
MSIPRLLICGCGKMGGAMLKGALAGGWPASSITVVDPFPSPDVLAMQAKAGFTLNPAEPPRAEMMLISIKPQMLDQAAEGLARCLDGKSIVVSIMAGKSIADMRKRLPQVTRFVRAMPNTPAALGRGITGAYATDALSEADRTNVTRLLQTTGRLEWVEDEGLIDAVTAVSGSGPAYVFHMVEALAKAGEELGLEPAIAARLARATIEGAGELLFREAETSPAELRRNVTSPGGTTAAALAILMGEGGLTPLMTRAVAAAEARAKALAG